MLNLFGRAAAQNAEEINRDTLLTSRLSIFTGDSIREIIARIINGILILAGIIAVVYLIYGGILYITASGNSDQADKGRTTIVNAVIGIVIIFVAIILVRLVRGILESGAGGV